MAAEPTAIPANTRQAKTNARIRKSSRIGHYHTFSTRDLPPPDKNTCSAGQRKSVCFDINEGPAENPDRSVETRAFCPFEIDEKASDPRRKMLLEEDSVSAVRRKNVPADQSCHYLTEKAGMVFRLDSLGR